MGPGSLNCQEGAAEVGGVDRVPVLGGDPGKRLVPEDPGVGDHDVYLAPGLEGGGDQLVALLNRVVVGHGLAPRILDLLDHDIRRLGVPPATISRGSEVIDNNLASSTGQEQSVGASQTFIKGRRSTYILNHIYKQIQRYHLLQPQSPLPLCLCTVDQSWKCLRLKNDVCQ